MRRTSFPIAARVSGVVARSVPVSAARSGMMFGAVPEWIDPTHRSGGSRSGHRRVDASGDDGLEGRDQRRRADDGVGRFVRARAVSAFAEELDLERIGGRSEWSRVGDHLSDGEPAIHVSAEDGFHVVERAGVEDGLRALTDFFGRLQHDEHVTGGRLTRQQQRGADGPGAVDVVPAGVHDAGRRRGERQPGGFLDRQRVDVTADRHEGCASITAREPGDDTRLRDRPDVDGA